MKKVTVKDIAKRSGCSVSAVSKALNGTDRVGADTVEKIKKIAMEMGYRSSFSAQSLARKGRKIAIVLFRHPVEVRRLFEEGFRAAFALYGEFGIEPEYHLYDAICDTDWEAVGSADGAIVVPGKGIEDCDELLSEIGGRIPLVFLQSRPVQIQAPRLSEVAVNARVVGALAAQFLGVCAPGCRTAVITGLRDAWIHRENLAGFLAAAPGCGIENLTVAECRDDMETAYACTARLLEEHPDLGGIFATSYVSPAVCRCIADRGRNVRVIGVDLFADSAACLRERTLDAAIFQNQQLQAQLAVEAVVNSFREITPDAFIPVKPELVLRTNLSCYRWN